MSYNPEKDMPRTAEQLEICVDHYFTQDQQKYKADVAKAKAQAEADYKNLPDSDNKPTLADFIAQAVSMVTPAPTREEWKQHFLAAGYGPQREMPEQPAPTFAELKQDKKAELDAAFYTACMKPFVVTAEGWRADANEAANRNVKGLIDYLEMTGGDAATFMDYDNIERPVTLAGLKALYLQIIQKGQQLYAAKWQMRTAIEAAANEAELAQVSIGF